MSDEIGLREEAKPFLSIAFLPILWAIRTRLPDGERLTIGQVRERLQVRTHLQDIAEAANTALIEIMPELISADVAITKEVVEIILQALSEILGDECNPDDYLKVMERDRLEKIHARAADIFLEHYRQKVQQIMQDHRHGQS